MSPIIKSAKKALRQNIKRRTGNLRKKRKIKDLKKQVKTLISEQKTDEAKKLLPNLYKALDKAGKTGVIKKNKASREKSRITKMLNALSTKSQIPNPKPSTRAELGAGLVPHRNKVSGAGQTQNPNI